MASDGLAVTSIPISALARSMRDALSVAIADSMAIDFTPLSYNASCMLCNLHGLGKPRHGYVPIYPPLREVVQCGQSPQDQLQCGATPNPDSNRNPRPMSPRTSPRTRDRKPQTTSWCPSRARPAPHRQFSRTSLQMSSSVTSSLEEDSDEVDCSASSPFFRASAIFSFGVKHVLHKRSPLSAEIFGRSMPTTTYSL